MSKVFKSSSPGKIILLGEHSVVYPPKSAVLTTINLHADVECEVIGDESEVVFIEPASSFKDFKIGIKFDRNDCLSILDVAREKHQISNLSELKEYLKKDRKFMRVLFGIIFEEIGNRKLNLPSIRVTLNSEIPYSSGFGSSAAYSSAIISAVFKSCGVNPSKDDMYKLTLEFEKFQHGNPSGADPAVIINGGLIEFSRNINGATNIRELGVNLPAQAGNKDLSVLLSNCTIIHTGASEESTGEMVDFVRQQVVDKKKETLDIFEEIEKCIEKFLDLNHIHTFSESNKIPPYPPFSKRGDNNQVKRDFINIINNNGQLLEELGVVSQLGQNICKEIREAGGAAKISGAGGIKSACGALLVYHENKKFIQQLVDKYNVRFLKAGFGVKGTN